MRRQRRQRSSGSRGKRPRKLFWLFVLLCLGAAGVWWQFANSPGSHVPVAIAGSTSGLRTTSATRRLPHNASAAPTTNPPAFSAGFSQSILESQIALERLGLSPGSLDGRMGTQTRAAVRAFQQKQDLPLTGELDTETKLRLVLDSPACGACQVTSNDIARLQPLAPTWLGKSRQSALDHETILELVAEKSHSHPDLIRLLNPGVQWTNVVAGTVLQVPDITPTGPLPKAAFVRLNLSGKTLVAFDEGTNLLAHFPCSIAQRVEKRPTGELRVSVLAPNPNYTFNPNIFPESAEARELNVKLILPPGPNNPVGTVWIGLDRPGYGIHGTPGPEQVGRTESHGCFRLANWNAERLLELVWVGMPVYVEP